MSYSTRAMQPADWLALRYFKPNEFVAPEKMGHEFMVWLDAVRHRAGVPMHITSSYRTPAYNMAVGGADDSAHCDEPCSAVDIGERPTPEDFHWSHSRYRIIEAAIALGCQRIGTYANGSIHLDMTHDERPHPAMWRTVR
jgi:uncharacterized protein YcbK (DUF882 family)